MSIEPTMQPPKLHGRQQDTLRRDAVVGGTFVMGSPGDEADRDENEGPQFQVQLEPFWMGRFEVTWDECELWAMEMDRLRRQHAGAEPTERDLTSRRPPREENSRRRPRSGAALAGNLSIARSARAVPRSGW